MSDTPIPPPPGPPPGAPPQPPPAAPQGPAPTGGGGGNVSPNRTLWFILSYLWLLALIPFLVEKDDKEVQWHAKHGLVLLGLEFVAWIAIFIIGIIAGMMFDFLGCIFSILNLVLWLGFIALRVFCIYKATQGERFKIQGVSDFADRF